MAKLGAVLAVVGAIILSAGCSKKTPDTNSPAATQNPAPRGDSPTAQTSDNQTDADQKSEFAKKIACAVGVSNQDGEPMDLTYDSTMKVLSLNLIVTQEKDGTSKIHSLKTAADMSEVYGLLLANEVNSSWVSPGVIAYAPSSLQQLYQNQKMRAAGKFIIMAEARIYSIDGNPGDLVKLLYRDLPHGDELASEPNQKVELKIKDNLVMTAHVPAVGPNGKETSVVIEIACAIGQ